MKERNSKIISKHRETLTSFFESLSTKRGFFSFLNPNIKYTYAIYFLLIVDCLTKFSVDFRSKGASDSKDYLFHLIQISLNLTIILINTLFELFFRHRKSRNFNKINDYFYFLISVLISANLLEERLKTLDEANNYFLEGCKLIMIQWIWNNNFLDIRFVYVSFSCNIIYFIGRMYWDLTENTVAILLITLLFFLHTHKKKTNKKPTGKETKYKNFLTNNPSTKKKITTFFEEHEMGYDDFLYLFENLLDQSSDGFILFDHKMDSIFNNKALFSLFPSFKENNFKKEVLTMEINNVDEKLQAILNETQKKHKKLMDLNEILTLHPKKDSQILNSISLDEDNEAQGQPLLMQKALETLNNKDFPDIPVMSHKLMKIQEYSFGFRTDKITSSDPSNLVKGELAVFSYKMRKLFLICFKKEMVANKILDNFNKVIDYISGELANSLNCIIIMLQMMQSSTILHKKLLSEFVNPALVCSKFLTQLKNELGDMCDILRGKVHIILKDFNLKELALEILNMFAFHCESKEIKLSLKYDNRIPTIIKSDPRFITQILTTLIKYSIKSSFKNSIYVKIEMEYDTNNFRISVSDSGSGFTKDERNNCIKTFSASDYFNSFNFDPCNIGYDLFSSHLLAIILSPENISEKGLTLISEQGLGSCFSFCIKDFEDIENLKDNEEEMEQVQSKVEKFNNEYHAESKFLQKDAPSPNTYKIRKPGENFSLSSFGNRASRNNLSPKGDASPKGSKNKNVSLTMINPVPRNLNSINLIKVNSLHDEEGGGGDNNTKSQKYTFNEFSKNEENTFTLQKSNFQIDEAEEFNLTTNNNINMNNSTHNNNNINSNSNRPRHSINKFLEIKLAKEGLDNNNNNNNDYSSIACSKLGSELVWSFSSDSQILKIISDFNVFEDSLRQIKEINKLKKCSCFDILICDYDEMSNYSIKNVFASLGFSAESVSMSYLALNCVKKKLESTCCKVYKFIFIFNNMPSITGCDLCRAMKKVYGDAKMPNPAMLAITSKISEFEQREIKDAGFLDYICKPIMQNTINFYVKKYLIIDLQHRRISVFKNQ